MALGKQNKIEGKAYSLKLKLKEGDTFLENGYFDVQVPPPDGKGKWLSLKGEELAKLTGSDKPLRDVTGDLVSVEPRIGEYEGNPTRSCKIGLRDSSQGETYFIEFGLGSALGKKLANSVLNLQGRDNVNVGLYAQTNKETKKTYPAAAVRQGDSDVTVKGKYDPKAEDPLLKLPPAREYEGKLDPKTKKPKIERDWTETEEFLIEKLKAFSDNLNDIPLRAAAPSKSAAAPEAPKPGSEEDLDQNPPF